MTPDLALAALMILIVALTIYLMAKESKSKDCDRDSFEAYREWAESHCDKGFSHFELWEAARKYQRKY